MLLHCLYVRQGGSQVIDFSRNVLQQQISLWFKQRDKGKTQKHSKLGRYSMQLNTGSESLQEKDVELVPTPTVWLTTAELAQPTVEIIINVIILMPFSKGTKFQCSVNAHIF